MCLPMDPSRWRLALRSLGKPLVLGVEGWVYGCRMISYRARCQHGALGATSRCVILAGPSHAVRRIDG